MILQPSSIVYGKFNSIIWNKYFFPYFYLLVLTLWFYSFFFLGDAQKSFFPLEASCDYPMLALHNWNKYFRISIVENFNMCFYLLLFLRLWYIVYNYVGLCHIKGWYKLLKYFGWLLLKHIGPTFGWCDAQLLGQLGQLVAQLVAAVLDSFCIGKLLKRVGFYVICYQDYKNMLKVLFSK